jgi:hypothetical protein
MFFMRETLAVNNALSSLPVGAMGMSTLLLDVHFECEIKHCTSLSNSAPHL